PLLVFGEDGAVGAGGRTACYEPFRPGAPARSAALIAAMLSWDGPGRQYRRSCVSYLEDVFELLAAAPGDPRVPVLDDVIHLLNPVAMRARMEYVPAAYPRREVLAAGATLAGMGVDGDGIIWLTECAALPRPPVTEMIARGRDTGLPVLAATASSQVAADLADLANVVVALPAQEGGDHGTA